MIHSRCWTVDVVIDEHSDERRTYAEARLRTPDRAELRGSGEAQRHPADPDVPAIGDELAVARALSDLAHRMLEAAASDLAQVTSAARPRR